jgi:hypothetical protein
VQGQKQSNLDASKRSALAAMKPTARNVKINRSEILSCAIHYVGYATVILAVPEAEFSECYG